MKKLLAVLLSAMMLTCLCAPFALAEDTITIEFWHSIEEAARPAVEARVEEFMKENPNIKVEMIYQGAYAKSNEALLAANAAGGDNLPAVHQTVCTSIGTFAENGVLTDMTSYMAASGFDTADFFTGMMEAYQYNGTQYAIPTFCSVCPTFYYNKTMAEEEDITIPTTWEEADEFVHKAAKKDENGNTTRYALSFAGWGSSYYGPIFWSNGVEPFADEDMTETGLGSEEALKVYKMIKSWVDEGLVKWCYGTNASSNMRSSFIDGSTFAVFHTTAVYQVTYKPAFETNGVKLGVAFQPAGTESYADIGGSGLTIPAKISDEKKAAAWKLIEFLTTPESNMAIIEATGYLPIRNATLSLDGMKTYLADNPEMANMYEHLDAIYGPVSHPLWTDISTLWQDAMAKIFNENADLESTIEELVNEVNEELADM